MYDVIDTQPALRMSRPNRTGYKAPMTQAVRTTAQRVFLAGHGLDKVYLAEQQLLAQKNVAYIFVSSADGVRTTIPVGEECVININTADAGYGNITCHIRSTSGSDVDIDVVDNGDGTVSILYTPRLPGAYTLNIKFGGQPVPNGDFVQQVWQTTCVNCNAFVIFTGCAVKPD